MFLETPRLRLRPFVPENAEAVFRYRSDPDVMRYVASGPDGTIEHTWKVLERYCKHQEKYGFSKWAVELRETGELIGDSGLLLLEEGPDFELGYRLVREYWGRGFATECGRAWLEAAFSRFGLERVVAFAHPENAASIRVMNKLGMTFERPIRVHGMDCVLYSICRQSYFAEENSRQPPKRGQTMRNELSGDSYTVRRLAKSYGFSIARGLIGAMSSCCLNDCMISPAVPCQRYLRLDVSGLRA